MTKKHYIEIAEILRVHMQRAFNSQDAGRVRAMSDLTDDFVSFLKKDNTKFDAEKFKNVIYQSKQEA